MINVTNFFFFFWGGGGGGGGVAQQSSEPKIIVNYNPVNKVSSNNTKSKFFPSHNLCSLVIVIVLYRCVLFSLFSSRCILRENAGSFIILFL